jgi:hypothetical protein
MENALRVFSNYKTPISDEVPQMDSDKQTDYHNDEF